MAPLMTDTCGKHRQHLLHHKFPDGSNSFIANVNNLVAIRDILTRLDSICTPENVEVFKRVAQVDFPSIIKDLEKGSYNGLRKLDINLLKNFADYEDDMSDEDKLTLWNTPSKQVYYDSATVTFSDKTSIFKMFEENLTGVNVLINNHRDLYTQLSQWSEFNQKCGFTVMNISADNDLIEHELLRIVDGVDSGSTIETITLHVAPHGANLLYDEVFSGVKDENPTYDWAETTSAFETLITVINDIKQVSVALKDLKVIYTNLDSLLSLANNLNMFLAVYEASNIVNNNLENINTVVENIETIRSLPSYIEELEGIRTNFVDQLQVIIREEVVNYLTSQE